MKLTNYQLDILTDEIYKAVNDKIKKYKNSKSFKKELEKYEKENSEIIDLIKQYENNIDTINRLQESQNIIKENIIKKGNYRRYTQPTSVKQFIENKKNDIISKFYQNFPSRQTIKSQIVLLNLSGSKDIIKNIKDKFNL